MPQSGRTEVVTIAPDGSGPRLLGTLGHVGGLRYGSTEPGGCAQLSCTLAAPPSLRSDALEPGRVVRGYRGGGKVWEGKLDQPKPTAGEGWPILAHGTGTLGGEYRATYASGVWANNPDESVNDAITRGLPWTNPGIGSPSGLWLGQRVDEGAQTITDLLNLVTSHGGLTWQVSCPPGPSNTLSVFPLPSAPTRLLICTTPVGRTLGADINAIVLRYQVTDDKAGAAAAYTHTTVVNQASIDRHGRMEEFIDLSSVGMMTLSAAQAVGNFVLQRYQRATFADPFGVSYGQLCTMGGTPVDLGCEQAGEVYKLIVTDYAYGGELTPATVTFLGGGYEFDQDSGLGQVTAFGTLRSDFSSLVSLAVSRAKPWVPPKRPAPRPRRRR